MSFLEMAQRHVRTCRRQTNDNETWIVPPEEAIVAISMPSMHPPTRQLCASKAATSNAAAKALWLGSMQSIGASSNTKLLPDVVAFGEEETQGDNNAP